MPFSDSITSNAPKSTEESNNRWSNRNDESEQNEKSSKKRERCWQNASECWKTCTPSCRSESAPDVCSRDGHVRNTLRSKGRTCIKAIGSVVSQVRTRVSRSLGRPQVCDLSSDSLFLHSLGSLGIRSTSTPIQSTPIQSNGALGSVSS